MGAESIIRGEDDEMQRLVHRVMGGIDLPVTRGGGNEAAEKRRGEVIRGPPVGVMIDKSSAFESFAPERAFAAIAPAASIAAEEPRPRQTGISARMSICTAGAGRPRRAYTASKP